MTAVNWRIDVQQVTRLHYGVLLLSTESRLVMTVQILAVFININQYIQLPFVVQMLWMLKDGEDVIRAQQCLCAKVDSCS